mmetsp:Transcript_30990/g.89565  ORF Transcript_30990/g.89565 Transcript_30990/m.89565 type:complete len:203 (-) Transcript_30990:591-1199(-)
MPPPAPIPHVRRFGCNSNTRTSRRWGRKVPNGKLLHDSPPEPRSHAIPDDGTSSRTSPSRPPPPPADPRWRSSRFAPTWAPWRSSWPSAPAAAPGPATSDSRSPDLDRCGRSAAPLLRALLGLARRCGVDTPGTPRVVAAAPWPLSPPASREPPAGSRRSSPAAGEARSKARKRRCGTSASARRRASLAKASSHLLGRPPGA